MGKSLYQIKLEQRRKKSKKDTIITDMDYVLRDKDEKDTKNSIDMTPNGVKPGSYEAKHKEEIDKLKAEIQGTKDTEIEELKKQVAALVKASKPTTAKA